MINNYFARGVSATALMLALATMPANAQEALPAIEVGTAQPADAPADPPPPAVDVAPGFTPERMKLPVYRDPPGQTMTTVDTKIFQNESILNVGDLLDYSPGVTIAQGNSARDVVISIRGSGARTSTGLANIVVLEDGFSLTTANGGVGNTLNMDPHAYGAVDVYRGGSSALWGNYAMEGAVNFRMRSGAQIDGVEIGSEYGSFGSAQNWAIGGKKVGDFDLSVFASDARSDGYIYHTDYNTQTFDFLGTWSPTPTDRVVLKLMQNDWFSDMGGRENFTQYTLNPFQQGYGCAYQTPLNAPFCAAVAGAPLPANAIYGKGAPTQSPDEIGMHRHNNRDVVGLRYEHDFDSLTTWRTQAMYDYGNVEQPNNPTQTARGPTEAVNLQTDITSHAPIFGYQATHFLNFFYNNAHNTNDAYWTVPYNFNQGAVGALSIAASTFQSDTGLKAREEVALSKQLTAVVGFSSTWTKIYGFSDTLNYTSPVLQSQPKDISAAHSYWNYAPEATLTYRASPEMLFRARYETAYATPTASALFIDNTGNPGLNTSLKTQTSQGVDFGFDLTPAGTNLIAKVTLFNEWWHDEFLSQLTPAATTYTSNIPASIHRGVEATIDWKFYEGWRAIGNYTFNDQFFKNLDDTLAATPVKGANYSVGIQRSGDRLPGVPQHQFTGRIAYDQPFGDFKGLGAFVEYQFRSDVPMDNANLLWAPGYGVVNADIHYTRDIEDSFIKKFTVYFDVKNIFDRTYMSSITVVANSFITHTWLQNPAAVLANSGTGDAVIPGSPRALYVGVKLKF